MGKKRKNVKKMMDAVEAGQAFTLTKKGEPRAIVIPWKDWQELNTQLLVYKVREAMPESKMAKLAQEAEHGNTRPETTWSSRAGKVVMATPDDEEELRRAYGVGSEELATEAERGYGVGVYTARNEISDRREPR